MKRLKQIQPLEQNKSCSVGILETKKRRKKKKENFYEGTIQFIIQMDAFQNGYQHEKIG